MKFKFVKNKIIVGLLFFVASIGFAQAQNFERVAKDHVEIPGPDTVSSFSAKSEKRISLGQLHLDTLDKPLEVSLTISNSFDWHIQFRVGKAKKVKAYIYFRVENATASFKGMYLQKSLRGAGLSKPVFKYYAMFAKHYGLKLSTEPVYKPMFAKILQDFGFSPADEECEVDLLLDREAPKLHVYPHGFELDEKLIKSQNMTVLKEKPSGNNVQSVFVNTKFSLPDENATDFWTRIEGIPGRYVLYASESD